MKQIKLLIYKVLDFLLLGRGVGRNISGFNIKFPARWSRYFEGDYEQANVDFLKANVKPGAIVFDIGAHLGLMSVICAKLNNNAGAVFAFEPTPGTFGLLQKIVKLNGASCVQCVNKAVAKQSGMLEFYLSADEGSNSNSLVTKNSKRRKAVKVEVVSVDEFAREKRLANLHFIKIDAEGSELDVLKGAEKTLMRFRPKMILALHPALIVNNNQTLREIYDLIRRFKYTIMLNGEVVTRDKFCSTTDFFDVHLIPGR
jgi:FkbM family methyltransferase